MKNETSEDTIVKVVFYDRTSCNNLLNAKELSKRSEELYKVSELRFGKGKFELLDTYFDYGYSGTSVGRPALAKMISDAQNAEWTHLITLGIDRVSRSENLLKNIYGELDALNKVIVFPTCIEGSRAAGDLILVYKSKNTL